jgi:HNH endonuclease.
VLNRDAWVCRACGTLCSDKRQAHADHVSPVVPGTDACRDGRSRYDVAAGQCLCASCHQAKTNREMLKN